MELERFYGLFPALVAVWIGLLTVPHAEAGSAEGVSYEEPPTLNAAERLPSAWLEGPKHAVDPEVRTDGFMAYFTIHSDYGTYRAAFVEEAATRLREIQAMVVLDDMRRLEAVGKGVVGSVKQPFLAVKNVATQPVETVQNVGEGVGRWVERGKLSLHKLGRRTEQALGDAKEAYGEYREEKRSNRLAEQEVRDRAIAEGQDPELAVAEFEERRAAEEAELAESADVQRNQERLEWVEEKLEKASLEHLGYDKARRQLAGDLGVDPYSTNLALQERLDAMAWSLWIGRLAAGFTIPSEDLLSQVESINDLVWKSHPKDLEVQNRKQMKAMGVEKELLEGFFEHPLYNTSDHTHMIADLATLDGVSQRDHFFRLAVAADSKLFATYHRRNASLLAYAHRFHPLDFIVSSSEKILVGMSREGALLLLLPVDHLAWTESLDLLVGAVERKRREVDFDGEVLLLLGGDLTSRARQELEAVGWTVETWGLGKFDVGP